MPTTRRSARASAQQSSSPVQDSSLSAGTKRKTDATGSSPTAKRGKKNVEKQQKTIEDTMDIDTPQENGHDSNKDSATDAADKGVNGNQATTEKSEDKSEELPEQSPVNDTKQEADKSDNDTQQQSTEQSDEKNNTSTNEVKEQPKVDDTTKADQPPSEKPADSLPQEPSQSSQQNEAQQSQVEKSGTNGDSKSESAQKEEQSSTSTTNGNAVEPHARDDAMPSSILEKGIIYFFLRARVNISDPQDTNDVARSYFILRPIPTGAKLGDGPIGDDSNCRLLALPKKVFPKSGKDRFMTFVENAKSSFKELKDNFMSASDYTTKTAGTSHTPTVTPLAEGVYAITTTGRESHLAYMLTIPAELGEVQKDMGLSEQGSFVVSAKNPKFPGPANTNIGGDPGYSEEIMQEFRDLRWMPLQPKLLDYVNTQFLLIGESFDGAVQELPRDEKKDTDTPKEEMEKLEGEDEIRVKHLKGDDAVFADLGISKKEYPSVPTTWA